jgi:hypothetical protein
MPHISIDANIEDYPFLKIAKRDSLFNIEGLIINCSVSSIEIEAISIKPCPPIEEL